MTRLDGCWRAFVVSAVVMLCAPDAQAQTRIRLTRDTIIDGVRCAPTGRAYAVVHANGVLDECPLHADTVIAGHPLPRLTWIRLHPDRTLHDVWLPQDLTVQGIPCKGSGYKAWSVRFHPGGRLALCYLARDAMIDGVPCRAAAFVTELSGSTQVGLHDNGRLRSCRLSRSVTRDGLTLKRGARIVLTPDGRAVARDQTSGGR
jgi:hypothetical protein